MLLFRLPLQGVRVGLRSSALALWPVLVALLVSSGCEQGRDAPPPARTQQRAAAPPPNTAKAPAPGVTIRYDPDGGRAQVSGGKPMTGDPKACAAFRTCCGAPSLALFCGLTEASESDCTKAHRAVKAYIKESGARAPSGC
jgi:hypothetical protein